MPMGVTKIEKRNGEIVSFSKEKIWKAISKAFLDVRKMFTSIEAQDVDEVTSAVVAELNEKFQSTQYPTVEQVQDLVEEKLMQRGYYDVAKGYIIYRREHEQMRLDAERGGGDDKMTVTKRSGVIQSLNPEKIRATLEYASRGYESLVDLERLLDMAIKSMYDGIKTQEITEVLTLTVRSFIEEDPSYSYVAARLQLNSIYREVIGEHISFYELDTQYRHTFVANVKEGVARGHLSEDLLSYNLEWLAAKLKPERDAEFKYLGIYTLQDRYFIKDPEDKKLFETPQAFWMRVAMGLALVEHPSMREKYVVDFYEVMSTLKFVPSTPTLFHSGTNRPQLSSCYLSTVEDDLGHIFKCIGDNAQMSKYSGGIGTDWTNLRATGALIRGTGVESQGIIPFLKVMNDTTAAINRSGKRRGAAVAYLETWHLDIESFLELRKNTGDERRRTHDMNTANWIPDLFIKRVRSGQNWTLFSPDETPDLHHIYGQEFERQYVEYEKAADRGEIKNFKRMPAVDLWRKMITMLFETGHPWITFKDPSNVRSPQDHVGVVHNSNLCTEITLNNSAEETAVCNLGSLNLSKYVRDGKFDAQMVEEIVPIAMRMLDNVVDINFYPTKEGETSNLRHRPVGLGVMGFQDALYLMKIDFDSDEAVRFADESQEIISYHAILASSKLAEEKGPYSTFKGSKWDRGIFPVDTIALLEQERGISIPVDRVERLDWSVVRESVRKYGMRNSNTMAMAPTATISNIADAIPTIEPIYKNIYVKSNQAGDFTIVNEYLIAELKERGIWNHDMLEKIKFHDGKITDIAEIPADIRSRYKEVFEIDGKWLIKAAAYRGKWIDQSQSLNIFYQGNSGKEIADVYMYAWEMGVKTTYYLRTLAMSQVEKASLDTNKHGVTHKRGQGAVQSVPGVVSPPVSQEYSATLATPISEPVHEIDKPAVAPAVQIISPTPSQNDLQAVSIQSTPTPHETTPSVESQSAPQSRGSVQGVSSVSEILQSKPQFASFGGEKVKYQPKVDIYKVAEGQICESCQ
jgi:ribonucleoside-diphosphate reductase alpha chain